MESPQLFLVWACLVYVCSGYRRILPSAAKEQRRDISLESNAAELLGSTLLAFNPISAGSRVHGSLYRTSPMRSLAMNVHGRASPRTLIGEGGIARLRQARFLKLPRRFSNIGMSETTGKLESRFGNYEFALVRKVLSSPTLVGFAVGDMFAQIICGHLLNFNWLRLLRLASFGFLVHGPAARWFYPALDSKLPGRGSRVVFTKVIVEQLLWAPLFGLMFFTYLGIVDGRGVAAALHRLNTQWYQQVLCSWALWPLAHFLNHQLIPSSVRVTFINSVQILYTFLLSVVAYGGA